MFNSKPTAGTEFRNWAAAPGVGLIDFPSIPADTKIETFSFKAIDGGSSRGVLYTRGGEKTVVCVSHPRADMSQHYMIPEMLKVGMACYSHQCRGLNNDVDCVHEELLLDLAAGYAHLRKLGFEKIILYGNSGGGSLACFYQSEASKEPDDRLKQAPAGAPTRFAEVDMPKADGVILIGVHPGEGVFMQDCLDPSVIDESNPLSVDPSLDMYDPANGFREPPERSEYSDEFLEGFRAGQRDRMKRLDAKAHDIISEQNRYKAKMKEPGFAALPIEERIYITRRAVLGEYLVIYRTEANPAYCDLRLNAWKSTRTVGSIVGSRPDMTNYAPGGFARYITPRAWLSSWSISSNAAIPETIKSLHEPLLIVAYTGDNGCFPADNQAQLDAAPAKDKEILFVGADHYGLPLDDREKANVLTAQWVAKRFPASGK
jgi:hypothetical protein